MLNDKGFDDKPMLDRAIGVGIAAHEGQLFGIASQLLGLATALGLIAMCISAVVARARRLTAGAFGHYAIGGAALLLFLTSPLLSSPPPPPPFPPL